ncbi:C4-dicarboxylate transporter DctA [Amycolatopsis nigrescens]|uniref:C4-dicarboxylate transporter DctA n=1 Tax=Amycolatopsis nigrescens TaxID=381445 RepID=UPI00037AF17D|nr:C4-dicarboxylate transporter DctA [Amycolatopsis nigrescens]
MVAPEPGAARKPWYRQLYVWVLAAIALGVGVGLLWPSFGASLEPLGNTFIAAIKMVIAPIVFVTVVTGIASVDSLRRVGRLGVKTLLYFQGATLTAMLLGLVAINVFRPGDGVHADPSRIEVSDSVAGLIDKGEHESWWHFLTDIVPSSMVAPFAEGKVLQVVFIAIMAGIALNAVGEVGEPVVDGLRRVSAVIFKMLGYVMYAAPVGAFGAMAYSVGKFGTGTLAGLGKLILVFYGSAAFFVIVVLGGVGALIRVNIFKLLRYFREELLLVLGTSSSDAVLPRLMTKLERLGVPRDIVGLTVPTGYSFNMDGIAMYLSLAAVFIAQATDTPLSLGMQLALVGVMILTSKGSAGVTGAGFVILAATLSTTGTVPAAGIMLIFGIDKFMSECRALVNFCGNALASLVIARWEGVLDVARVRRRLDGSPDETVARVEPVEVNR